MSEEKITGKVHDKIAFVMEYNKYSHGLNCEMQAGTTEALNPSLADFWIPKVRDYLRWFC